MNNEDKIDKSKMNETDKLYWSKYIPSGLEINAWNAAIEAAAALLEMDDEILPYTIEQIRKLKK